MSSRKTILILMIALLVIFASAATAKSVYVLSSHHALQFDAWNINPDGTVNYQGTYNLLYARAPAGVAVHEPSGTLFISSETRDLELVDATTFASLGELTGTQFAGVAVDDRNDVLYAMLRSQNQIYAYDFTRSGNTWALTPKAGFPRTLTALHLNSGMGIALDELSDPPILWVADCGNMMVRAYPTDTWIEDASLSFSTADTQAGAIGMGIDRRRGIVYWGSMNWGAATPPNAGTFDLYKYDLGTQTLTWQYVGHDKQVVDVSVDEDTGLVYITETDHMSVWDTTTPQWSMLQRHSFGAFPATAGLAVTNVSFMPELAVEKVDDVPEGECAPMGGTIEYTVSYENTGETGLTNVTIVDDLPGEVDMADAGSGTYDALNHQITWTIGDVAEGETGSIVCNVQLNAGASPGGSFLNYATSASDETPATTVQHGTDVCTNQAPDCSEATPTVDMLWPPNHRMVAVGVEGVTDPDGDTIAISVDSIFQDEPVDSFGDGSFVPDGTGVGNDVCEVRAERSGSRRVPGNGRFYHIGFTADDGMGGTCSGEVLVVVPHDRRKGGVPIDDGPLYDSTAP